MSIATALNFFASLCDREPAAAYGEFWCIVRLLLIVELCAQKILG